MKRLTWLSKKFLFAKSSPHQKLGVLGLALGVLFIAASCRMTGTNQDEWSLNPFANLTDKFSGASDTEDVVSVHIDTPDGPRLGALVGEYCQGPSKSPKTMHWRIPVTTYFGNVQVDVSIKPLEVNQAEVIVESLIEGRMMRFIPDKQPNPEWIANACATYQETSDRPARVAAHESFAASVRSWLEHMIPDCEFARVGGNGWECALPASEPQSAMVELTGIRSTMMRRWSRQPYVLTRRLNLALRLAESLAANDPHPKLDTLCKVVGYSLPIELPAIVATDTWQRAVCRQPGEFRLAAANYGLSKALAEIDLLRQLFERTSKLGYLTLKIPSDKVPTRRLWINLQPEGDVATELAKEAAALWATEKDADATQADPPRYCWHPVFAESDSFLAVAEFMALAGEPQAVECGQRSDDQTSFATQYVADSITSETEFVVSNGRAKMLRLPIGHYTYSLHSLPANPADWDDAATTGPSSTGRISWSNRRPRPTIRTW